MWPTTAPPCHTQPIWTTLPHWSWLSSSCHITCLNFIFFYWRYFIHRVLSNGYLSASNSFGDKLALAPQKARWTWSQLMSPSMMLLDFPAFPVAKNAVMILGSICIAFKYFDLPCVEENVLLCILLFNYTLLLSSFWCYWSCCSTGNYYWSCHCSVCVILTFIYLINTCHFLFLTKNRVLLMSLKVQG